MFNLSFFMVFIKKFVFNSDQTHPDYLFTSKCTEPSEENFQRGFASKGFKDSASVLSNSYIHHFCERLHTPFVETSPSLLLPRYFFCNLLSR